MKRLLTIIFVLVFNFSFLNAEVIKDTIIKGNKRISDETILLYGDIKLGKDYSEADINNIITFLIHCEEIKILSAGNRCLNSLI